MADRPLWIDIEHPLIVKNDDLFLVTTRDGSVPQDMPGFGLFWRDCRYLSRYELSLNGTRPLALMSAWNEGFASDMELTNADLKNASDRSIASYTVGITRKHLLMGEECLFVDVISFRNFSLEEVEIPVALEFAAGFESTLMLRGAPQGKRGTMLVPEWGHKHLRFGYRGADEILRSLEVSFSMVPVIAPRMSGHSVAHFDLVLKAQECKSLIVSCRVSELPGERAGGLRPHLPPTRQKVNDYQVRMSESWLEGFTGIDSSEDALRSVLRRSLSDIRLLRLARERQRFIGAGVPWFVAVFGRDSLIPSLQCLAYEREIAAHTVRLLARQQGNKIEERRHEEPGKILHELRVGELANLKEIPETPSYASIDSTIFFLILIARQARWTGNLDLFNELRENVDRALHWMAAYGDRNGDGYIEYYGKTDKGAPVNQGWKDSGDGIVREDGSFPEPPISLVEVQAYAYLAKREIAELYRRAGEQAMADRLEEEAAQLRRRFNRDFWMEEKGCYCLALEGDGRQVSVIASNAGHALWSGIADRDKALKTARRLMKEDMFSGWGIRTLSAGEARYNPLAYQLGSIWPFDNSLIMAGFRRYGLDDLACQVFTGILDAARRFPNGRLPEFFAGTQREKDSCPTRCPRADPLQAWSSGTVPLMVAELLGLHPDGFAGKLRIVRPVLPERIQQIELRGLKVGTAAVDLRFEREGGGRLVPRILAVEGDVKIQLEEDGSP